MLGHDLGAALRRLTFGASARTALPNAGSVFPPQSTSEGTACDHTVGHDRLSPSPSNSSFE